MTSYVKFLSFDPVRGGGGGGGGRINHLPGNLNYFGSGLKST